MKPLETELAVSALAPADSLAEQHSEPGSEPDSELQELALGLSTESRLP
ncbi:adenine phosphoribosyltransferase [Vibrio sp. MED222]|nr:adenine phosphoribosyltransferase [Vibrio sp. MED222]